MDGITLHMPFTVADDADHHAWMIAHMSDNGAGLRPGDFFGSGNEERGSFLELSRGGKDFFALPDGTGTTFRQDGQTVTLTGTAPGPGGSVIDLGECAATILPAT